MRRRRGERYKSDYVLPIVKHEEGSLQVWGSITYSGIGHLYEITDNLTTPKYKQIRIHYAVPVGKALIGKNFVFQHTARVIKKYLENKKRDGSLTVLNWPAQSPDMNIIEQVWTYMEKVTLHFPVNLQQLWEVLQDIWVVYHLHQKPIWFQTVQMERKNFDWKIPFGARAFHFP